MKKLYILSFGLLTTLAFAQLHIPFTGTGALNANGWTTHSGTAGQLTIITTASDNGNSLSYPGLATSSGNRTSLVAFNSEDANFPLSAPLSGTVYYSALIKVLDAAQLDLNTSTSGSYGLCLTSNAGASATLFQGRLYTKQGATPNTFVLGVLNNSGGTATPSFISTDLAINTTHLIVVKYDIATNTASLFVNPTPGSAEPTPSATNVTGTSTAPTAINGFTIRQVGTAASGVSSGNIEVDEIRVNTTFADVTPSNLRNNQNAIAGLSIFPNPVKNGVFYINTDANAERTVTVFDVLGKQVLNTTTSESAINVSNLTAGVYMVQISEEGNTATKKLVIE